MNGYARFRDVRQAPDGKLYAMTETPNRFVLLRSNIPISTTIQEENSETGEGDNLYPNPSTGNGKLSFYMASQQFVTVKIININGALIKELSAQSYAKGQHTLYIDADHLSQGIYFVEINKGGAKKVLKWVRL
jgi:hypothetical protein